MLLKPEESENRDKYQKIIVSREPGENREHRAINPDGIYEVRHYQLDGKLVRNQTCCDYQLLNDTHRNMKIKYNSKCLLHPCQEV